jgi:replicative superfamily II helicase
VVESLMSEGLLTAVFATSTVAAGVNFPARTMVFFNSDRFNGTEFIPLDATQLHQMTGRAGRRGMDKIGFALAVPGRYMDLRLVARMLSSRPGKVVSRIRINFSLVLNLLLSHTPDQVEELLKRSFATWLLISKAEDSRQKSRMADIHEVLWEDFVRHLSIFSRRRDSWAMTTGSPVTASGHPSCAWTSPCWWPNACARDCCPTGMRPRWPACSPAWSTKGKPMTAWRAAWCPTG